VRYCAAIVEAKAAGDPKSSKASRQSAIAACSCRCYRRLLRNDLHDFSAIALIPLKNMLKNEVHADRAGTAAFFFWIQLAWYFKPFAGVVTDACPLFGMRRKSYMVIWRC
jgi:hypothetical protein